MTRGSLRVRLLTAGAASILFAIALAGGGLLLLFERHVERRVVLELQADLRQLAAGINRAAAGELELRTAPAEPRFTEPLSGLYWQIVPLNDPLLRSRSLWDTVLDLPSDRLADGEVHQHQIDGPRGARLLAVERSVALPERLGGGRVRVTVAIDRADIATATWSFARDLAIALPLLAAVLIAAAWAQVSIGLRPLNALHRRLGRVRAGQADRLGTAFPDELRPLAAELDHLLDAQDQAIARARTRAADLAHGLKTPLTVLDGTSEALRARGEAAAADEIAELAFAMHRHIERELVCHLHRHRGAAKQHDLVAPVELLGFARREAQRHIGIHRSRGSIALPAAGITPHCVVATLVAAATEFLEDLDQCQTLKWRPRLVGLQHGVEVRLPRA